jgi:hypothetical protein
MDQRELIGSLEESIRAAITGYLAEVWTAMPGIVESFNPTKMTCVVTVATKSYVRAKDGTQSWVQLPNLLDVPVIFPSAGLFTLTMPVTAGDEVLVIFASRCIDGWWQNSGVNNQPEIRFHDLSDGFALPGIFSQPNVLPSVSTTAAELRTNDGTCKISLGSDGTIVITAPNGVMINGTLVVTGNITSDADVKSGAGSHSLSTHVHGGVQSGSSDTTGPIG